MDVVEDITDLSESGGDGTDVEYPYAYFLTCFVDNYLIVQY